MAGAEAWDAASYAAARTAASSDPARRRLVSDLVATLLPAFAEAGGYVSLDEGLAVIAEHAHSLGYGAVVLFLDELILWLASHLQNREFLSTEGAKLATLVEAADARRTIPLVSFVARQRDLADFLGAEVAGAERAALQDAFALARGRLDEVTLEDRNLPLIAQKRLLTPKDEEARQALDAAFADIDRRPEVWDVLRSGDQVGKVSVGADEDSFRLTYPFSPALVATLVALSQALQRERTALKVMLQLLVNGRDTLTVGDLVPVGDLFDVVVDTDVQAVNEKLQRDFDTARRLYRNRVRPVLLDLHSLTEDQAESVPTGHAFSTDDRLMKTLLLAALAPEVQALNGLTASRLAALNHGTIRGFLPGDEVSTALTKVKQVAASVGEIHVGDGEDPFISVELTDLDYGRIIDAARLVDQEGNRKRALRELVWESLGIAQQDTLEGVQSETVVWRGRKNVIDLVFGNVRDVGDLADERLLASGDRWKVVVDYPFDTEGHTPHSDQARVEELRERGVRSQTLLWIPGFLTARRQQDLGTYVVLEHLLKGGPDHFYSFATHLNPAEREQARQLLRQRRDLLRERLVGAVKQAYGVERGVEEDIDTASALEVPFLTLAEGFVPRQPVAASLRDALHAVVGQALEWTYPEHPHFEPGSSEVRLPELRKVLEYCEQALDDPAGRVTVDQRDRGTLRRICVPLDVGHVGEAVFVLDDATFGWATAMMKTHKAGAYRVSDLRAALDQPRPRGLDRHVSAFLIHVFALQQDLAWFTDGHSVPAPPLESLRDDVELRQPHLPDEASWRTAVDAARDGLGLPIADLRNAAGLARLGSLARDMAHNNVKSASTVDRLLTQHAGDLGLRADEPHDRLRTAAALRSLLEQLANDPEDLAVVAMLAAAQWPTTAAAAKRSLETESSVSAALERANWQVFSALRTVGPDKQAEATTLLEELRDTARHDELVLPLPPVLASVAERGLTLLTEEPDPRPDVVTGSTTVQTEQIDAAVTVLRDAVAKTAGTVTVSWRIEPRGD